MLILATARLFVDYGIAHPLWMLCFLVLTAVIFSPFGFVLGIWADGFEKLQVVPLLIITPLTFQDRVSAEELRVNGGQLGAFVRRG